MIATKSEHVADDVQQFHVHQSTQRDASREQTAKILEQYCQPAHPTSVRISLAT